MVNIYYSIKVYNFILVYLLNANITIFHQYHIAILSKF